MKIIWSLVRNLNTLTANSFMIPYNLRAKTVILHNAAFVYGRKKNSEISKVLQVYCHLTHPAHPGSRFQVSKHKFWGASMNWNVILNQIYFYLVYFLFPDTCHLLLIRPSWLPLHVQCGISTNCYSFIIQQYTNIHISAHTCVWLCVCACVCVLRGGGNVNKRYAHLLQAKYQESST